MPINDYFNFDPNNYPTDAKAFSSTMRAFVEAVNAAFSLLPPVNSLGSAFRVGTTAGDETEYTLEIDGIDEYSDFLQLLVRFHVPNVGAEPTLDLNDLGPKPIIRRDGLDMDDGDLHHITGLVFDAQLDAFVVLDTPNTVQSKLYYRNFTVTSLTMHFDYYPGKYFMVEPQLLVTMWDISTDIDAVVQNQTVIPTVGSAYTSVDITFPSGYVGKKGTIVVVGV